MCVARGEMGEYGLRPLLDELDFGARRHALYSHRFGVRASHLGQPSAVRTGEISNSERRIVVPFGSPGLLVRRSSRWRGESRRRARPWPARGRRAALQQKPQDERLSNF